jgi:hypothetical protein
MSSGILIAVKTACNGARHSPTTPPYSAQPSVIVIAQVNSQRGSRSSSHGAIAAESPRQRMSKRRTGFMGSRGSTRINRIRSIRRADYEAGLGRWSGELREFAKEAGDPAAHMVEEFAARSAERTQCTPVAEP